MICNLSTKERFWSKVDSSQLGPGGCWLWTAGQNSNGYGAFWNGERQIGAHRFAYEALAGPISDELQIDHVRARGCHIRHCVNPAHLEIVTSAENTRRGDAGKHHRKKTHCPTSLADILTGEYTGRIAHRRVSYVMEGGALGVEPGYVVLGLKEAS